VQRRATVVHTKVDTRSVPNCRRFVCIAACVPALCLLSGCVCGRLGQMIESEAKSVCYRMTVARASCCGGQFRILTTRRQITAQCVCCVPADDSFRAARAPKRGHNYIILSKWSTAVCAPEQRRRLCELRQKRRVRCSYLRTSHTTHTRVRRSKLLLFMTFLLLPGRNHKWFYYILPTYISARE
jgi:hypothetical protein